MIGRRHALAGRGPGPIEEIRLARTGWKDDRALVRACRQGDAKAWEELIRRYRRLIYSIPLAFGFAADRADEIFQRVAVKLVEHLGEIRRVEGLASWIAVTARRECQAYAEADARFVPLDASESASAERGDPDVLEKLDAIEREHAVALAFERLAEPCRKLLFALYVEDPTPSYKEIAERLGRPVGSLGPTRARCLAKLAALYRRMGGPELSARKPHRPAPVGPGGSKADPCIKRDRPGSSGGGGER